MDDDLATDSSCAVLQSAFPCAALPRSAIIPRGAHRAPLKPFVKKVVTGQDRRIAAPHYAYRSEAYWYDIQYQY